MAAAAAGRPTLAPVWLRALSWVEANAAVFAIPEPADASVAPHSLKPAGEVARVAEAIGRAELPGEARATVARLMERTWRSFRGGALFAELLDGHPELAGLGALYAPFHRHGLVHEGTAARLSRLWQTAREVPPSRPSPAQPARSAEPRIRIAADAPFVLALSHLDARRALGLPEPEGRTASLLAGTLLGRRDPGPADAGFVSSVAHAALFATDCGARPHAVPADVRAHLRARGPEWQSECRERGDLDAWAELVLALACVGETAAAGDAEAVLRTAQREDGSLPGRPPHAYHATLTGALASFAVTTGLRRSEPLR